MEIDSAELARRAAAGNGRALEELWSRRRRWLAAVVVAHGGGRLRTDRSVTPTDLDDLLQEIAMIVVRDISTLRDPARHRAWLRAIAVNVVCTAARRRGGGRVTRNGVEHDIAGRPDRDSHRDAAETVMRAMLDLPLKYREVLLLKSVRGLSARHIAETLGEPLKTIETRAMRGRRLLLDTLGRCDPAATPSTPPEVNDERAA